MLQALQRAVIIQYWMLPTASLLTHYKPTASLLTHAIGLQVTSHCARSHSSTECRWCGKHKQLS
jgi:hypothetical protein